MQCLDILYGSGGSCPRNIGIILSSIQIMIFFIISVVLHVEEKSLRTQVHVKEKSLRTQVHVEEKSLRTQVAVNPVNIWDSQKGGQPLSVPLKSKRSKMRSNILSICEAIKAPISNCKDETYNLYYFHDHLQHHCFFPFSSTATRFHSSKLTSGLLNSLLIFSMNAFSKYFFGLIGTRARSKRSSFLVSFSFIRFLIDE